MAQQAVSTKVPFTVANVSKCVCPKCPVQSKSQCIASKLKTINASLKKPALKREDIPGIYCSTGNATCTDLDPKQSCICGTCNVYSQYKLGSGKPGAFFCKDGMAK